MPQPQRQPLEREGSDIPSINADFVTVSTRAAMLKRGMTKLQLKGREIKKPIFITSAFFNVILFIALIAVVLIWILDKKDPPIEICTSQECLVSGYRIATAINKNVNPCEDFFDFACGNWQIMHKLSGKVTYTSVFKETEDDLRKRALELLKEPEDNEPLAVELARGLYDECMRTELIELLGLYPLKEVLAKVGLPRDLPDVNTTKDFNLTEVLSQVHYHIPITDVLFELGITVHPKEETKKLLWVSTPKKQRFYKFLNIIGSDPESYIRRKKRSLPEFVTDEMKYRTLVMGLFESDKIKGTKLTESELRAAALKTLIFESDLAHKFPKTKQPCQLTTIAELQKASNKGVKGTKPMKIEWQTYIQNIFKNVKQKTIDENYQLASDAISFFGILARFIVKHKPETLQRYIWWKVVDFFAVHGTKAMREMRYVNEGNLDYKESTHRPMECMKTLEKAVPLAVIYKFLSQPLMNVTRMKIEQMLSDIKGSFMTIIEEADWMDENTTQKALEKLDNMNYTIGYLDEYIDEEYLDSLYNKETVIKGNFLQSVFNFYTAESKRALSVLDEPTNDQEIGLSEQKPFEMNAFHIFTSNYIIILPGLMQPPFYGTGLEVMNYAAMGSIIGHEITHGFDNDGHEFSTWCSQIFSMNSKDAATPAAKHVSIQGKKYDKNGNLQNWWSRNTTEEFKVRTQCFVKQYEEYIIFGKNLRGRKTLGENIADNGGIRQSYMAYQKYKTREGPEPRLPGLEEYTNEQLFFIAFAHTYCSNYTEGMANILLSSEHSPFKYRVIGSLSNMEEFSEAWNCPKGSPMNPVDKCILW